MVVNPIEVIPQPRIDTLVTDAVTGGQRRRTEYTGTAWFFGRPNFDDPGKTNYSFATIGTPFFLPDSLPYRPDLLDDAVVVCLVALQASGEFVEHKSPPFDYRAGLEPDPRNPAVCWVRVQVRAEAGTPFGVIYQVTVLVAPNAVLGP
jgi:hypothetical protein